MFVDVDWGGSTRDQPRYPAFINQTATWPLEDPSEQLILQDHDSRMLKRSLQTSRIMRRGVRTAAAVANTGRRAAGAPGAGAALPQLPRRLAIGSSRPAVFGRATFRI